MKTVPVLPSPTEWAPASAKSGGLALAAGWAVAGAVVAAAAWLTRDRPGWVAMLALAATEFGALKLATLGGLPAGVGRGRLAGYLGAWPGMNARAFFAPGPAPRPAVGEWCFAAAKLGGGAGLVAWATGGAPAGWAAPVGLTGLILAVHFGVFHLLSCAWRAAGVAAPPIMRAPIAATSLADLWGTRWNLAFADGARRFLVAPLARPLGARGAGWVVFAVSGLVHETVISLPARGGWGGPTLYFLLQAAGVAVERSVPGRRLGLGHGVRGWLWTGLVAAAPLPLLFHAPFVERVGAPLLRALAGLFLP